jgi:hypothetical protein
MGLFKFNCEVQNEISNTEPLVEKLKMYRFDGECSLVWISKAIAEYIVSMCEVCFIVRIMCIYYYC